MNCEFIPRSHSILVCLSVIQHKVEHDYMAIIKPYHPVVYLAAMMLTTYVCAGTECTSHFVDRMRHGIRTKQHDNLPLLVTRSQGSVALPFFL